ncbi:hypothetical protein MRX96_019024 [Rhipicephalus microplus]
MRLPLRQAHWCAVHTALGFPKMQKCAACLACTKRLAEFIGGSSAGKQHRIALFLWPTKLAWQTNPAEAIGPARHTDAGPVWSSDTKRLHETPQRVVQPGRSDILCSKMRFVTTPYSVSLSSGSKGTAI